MTDDEKRRDEAREIVHRLRDRYNAPGHELKLDLVEATDLVVAALASRDAEIERLRSDYNTTITYNIDERAKLASLLKEKDAEIERLRTAERQLSDAYIRLRALIPGAFDTPHGPSPAEVWAHTEAKLTELARLRAQPAADDVERADGICGWASACGFMEYDPAKFSPVKEAISAALTAARQDARRQALEEAARVCEDRYYRYRDRRAAPPALLASASCARAIRALADKPATTSPDIISLVRAYRRAVEASPVSNVLELQEWLDLCAAMNAIDAAEGVR